MPLIRGSITKNFEDENVGIAFNRKTPTSPLIISWIRPGGPFSDTDLVVGLLVQTINDVDATHLTPAEANYAVGHALPGELSVVGRGLIATAFKDEPSDKVGISLQQGIDDVEDVEEEQMKRNQAAQERNVETDKMLSSDKKTKKKWWRKLQSKNRAQKTRGGKARSSSRGSVENLSNHHVLITRISDEGLFKYSEHLLGLQLVSINGKLCSGKLSHALDDLRNASVQVTLVAWEPSWASYVEPEPEPSIEEEEAPEVIVAEESKDEHDYYFCGMKSPTQKENAARQMEGTNDQSFFTWACGNGTNDDGVEHAIETAPSKAFDQQLSSTSAEIVSRQ